MSEVQATSRRYQVVRTMGGVYALCDVTRVALPDFTVDRFRSRSAAEYAARLLNSGLASVDRHATVGCKVVAR